MRRSSRQQALRISSEDTGMPGFREDLVRDLRRHGTKLYGTAWCANCKAQKAMIYNMDPAHWKEIYVDCDLLLNSLETAYVRLVPAWRVAGEWHLGMQTESSLRKLLDERVGDRRKWTIGGDGYRRRHRRRGEWAKQDYAMVIRAAVVSGRQNAGLSAKHPPQPLPSQSPVPDTPQNLYTLPSLEPPLAEQLPAFPPPQETPASDQAPPKQIIQWSGTPRGTPRAATPRPPPVRVREVPSPISPGGPQPRSPSRLVPQARIEELAELLTASPSPNPRKANTPPVEPPLESTPVHPPAPEGWSRDRWADTEYGKLFLAVARSRFPLRWPKPLDFLNRSTRAEEVSGSPRQSLKYPKEYVRGNLGQPGSPRGGTPRAARWRKNEEQWSKGKNEWEGQSQEDAGPLAWLQNGLQNVLNTFKGGS